MKWEPEKKTSFAGLFFSYRPSAGAVAQLQSMNTKNYTILYHIACTARHGQIACTGVAPRSSLARIRTYNQTWVSFIVLLCHAWLVVSYDVPIETFGPIDTLVSYDVHYS